MLTAILGLAAAICAVGWIKNRVGLLAICHYMATKNCPPPSDAEMKASSEYVVGKLLKTK